MKLIYSHTGLRGIAAMCVFIAHLYFWNKDVWNLNRQHFEFFFCHDYAVDLFFILSGFVLNWVYVSNSKPIIWKSYILARVARIMPLYYLITCLFILIPREYLYKYVDPDLWTNYPALLTANLMLLSGVIDGWKGTLNGVGWSISVEFFCYLTIFPILYFAWKRLSEKKNVLLFLFILTLALTRLIVIIYRANPLYILDIKWNYSWLARGICGFTIGFLICCIAKKTKWIPSIKLTNIVLSVCLIIFIFSRIGIIPPHLIVYLLPIIVYFSFYDVGFLCELLKGDLFQWLGERSYSIYLWHFPGTKILTLIYSLIASYFSLSTIMPWFFKCVGLVLGVLFISDISYRYFEVPCRNYIRNKHN
jgi:peptidoglycan/LPS O-acetylase OafA/YrhL